jgi:hypothetical protein
MFASMNRGKMNNSGDLGYASSITLCVVGPELDPETVSTALGLKPDRAWRRGDKKSFQLPDGTTKVYDSVHEAGGWKMFTPETHMNNEIEKQLEYWAGLLASRVPALRTLESEGYECTLAVCLCPDSSVSITLSPELQQRLADIGLTAEVAVLLGAD